jgi:hypothetical protein
MQETGARLRGLEIPIHAKPLPHCLLRCRSIRCVPLDRVASRFSMSRHQVAHDWRDVIRKARRRSPRVDRGRQPEHHDPAEELVGGVGAATAQHAAIDPAAVFHVGLDCVQHHRIEQHAPAISAMVGGGSFFCCAVSGAPGPCTPMAKIRSAPKFIAELSGAVLRMQLSPKCRPSISDRREEDRDGTRRHQMVDGQTAAFDAPGGRASKPLIRQQPISASPLSTRA